MINIDIIYCDTPSQYKFSLVCSLVMYCSHEVKLASKSTFTFGSVDEVRGDVTPVKLHTLNDLQLIMQSLPILTCKACTAYVISHNRTACSYRFQVSRPILLIINIFIPVYETLKLTLTVMTPLRPTFFMALDMILPISMSPLAEIVATLETEDIMTAFQYKFKIHCHDQFYELITNYVHLCDLLRGCDWFGELFQLVNDGFYGHHDSTADLNRVSAFADGVEALLGNGTSQHCGSGGAITSLLIGVVGHVLHQLGTDVLVLVLQVDALGHRHTVLGDLRAAPALLNDDSATLE